jgi:hypothetical protein
MARKKSEDFTLYGALETEDEVEVELAITAPTRARAQHVLAEIVRAVTGDEPKDPGSRVVLTDGPGLPEKPPPGSGARDAE